MLLDRCKDTKPHQTLELRVIHIFIISGTQTLYRLHCYVVFSFWTHCFDILQYELISKTWNFHSTFSIMILRALSKSSYLHNLDPARADARFFGGGSLVVKADMRLYHHMNYLCQNYGIYTNKFETDALSDERVYNNWWNEEKFWRNFFQKKSDFLMNFSVTSMDGRMMNNGPKCMGKHLGDSLRCTLQENISYTSRK